ncbi:hypothetical protein CUMW_244880 [Citrus unshiu]|uniref:Uncharacterized protein n=1 Tax=Citrus unshiu TaxID=55188 RepID=A0A2H5QMU7_CITUN|nr:hypothetical protein CUMW_244880 [Citrus unshiu]
MESPGPIKIPVYKRRELIRNDKNKNILNSSDYKLLVSADIHNFLSDDTFFFRNMDLKALIGFRSLHVCILNRLDITFYCLDLIFILKCVLIVPVDIIVPVTFIISFVVKVRVPNIQSSRMVMDLTISENRSTFWLIQVLGIRWMTNGLYMIPLNLIQKRTYKNLKTGLTEAVQTGTGQLNGIPIAIGVMDFQFMGGVYGIRSRRENTRLIEYAAINFYLFFYYFMFNSYIPYTGGVTASLWYVKSIEQTLNRQYLKVQKRTEYLFDKGLCRSIYQCSEELFLFTAVFFESKLTPAEVLK